MKKEYLGISAFILCCFIILYLAINNNTSNTEQAGGITKKVTLLSATSTTATSYAINAVGAKRITLLLSRDVQGAVIGSTTFAVTVSPDGTNYLTYNKLIDNVANTNAQTLTRVASKTLTSTSTAMLSFDLVNDFIQSFKLTATRNNDGTSSAWAFIEY